MLYNLLYQLRDSFVAFNIFRYITFRAAIAALTTFFISLLLGKFLIQFLKTLNIQAGMKQEGCEQLNKVQLYKKGTPTMGGVLIVSSVLLATLLWANIFNKYVVLTLFAFLGLAVVGFIDDYIKLTRKNSDGLSKAAKFSGQLAVGLAVGLILYCDPQFSTLLHVPFFKNATVDLGIFYILFSVLVVCGSSNAVNFTDGLDGLAVGCMVMTALTFSILSYITGHAKFSTYLLIPFVPHAGELAIFCAAIMGACMGFLWFNCFPAAVFMGDVGSLAIGGAIGVVALIIKKEILLMVVGGIFVVEALSVILQIVSFKTRKKRVFKMAPLHHHFQISGMPESKIIIRFWIISAILALLTLLTLKIQ